MCHSANILPQPGTSSFPEKLELPNEQTFVLPFGLVSFYVEDLPGRCGLPQNGTLFEDSEYTGDKTVSIFDPVLNRSGFGVVFSPPEQGHWVFRRSADQLSVTLTAGSWTVHAYAGNEPDWNVHPFPFRNLPEEMTDFHHARMRGLLDFCAGTRTAANGLYYQAPNTAIGKGYGGDGIPDTFFHFISVYEHLSEKRQACFRGQFEWLGDHMRFDGCIPWGGCNHDQPYYHLWKRPDCGMFFDGNALWLEVMRRLTRTGYQPDLTKVVRAADFYLHYLSPDGLLVAAESKMLGCEWADLIKNGWKSSIINVLAYRGLLAASEILHVFGEQELASRYEKAAARLKYGINLPVDAGGLWGGDGFVDWVEPNGRPVRTWRIDTNMLAIVWDVATSEHAQELFAHFKKVYFTDEPAVPMPYLLSGSWLEPEDKMLENCRGFGCGRASMPGRMGTSAVAAARKLGDLDTANHILKKLTDLINQQEALWEMYDHAGHGSGARSYVEHSVAVMLADAWSRF